MKVGLRRENVLRRSVDCWCEYDCYQVEVYLATFTCRGYYRILYIGLSLDHIEASKWLVLVFIITQTDTTVLYPLICPKLRVARLTSTV